jgi:hypothetical protein
MVNVYDPSENRQNKDNEENGRSIICATQF